MPWFSWLFLALTVLILVDHLGSRWIRRQVQGRAKALYPGRSVKRSGRPPKWNKPPEALVAHISEYTGWPSPVRLKVKGARRLRRGGGWVPLEGRLFCSGSVHMVYYVDYTRWAFFSQKEWGEYMSENGLQARRFLFSVLPQKMEVDHELADALFMAWIPWWPTASLHTTFRWHRHTDQELELLVNKGDGHYTVRHYLSEEGEWDTTLVFCHDQGARRPVVRLRWSERRTFAEQHLPVRCTVDYRHEDAWQDTAHLQLTDWVEGGSYRWW